MTMRVAIVNPVWHPGAASPAETLDRFTTLTGWAEALAGAGAAVTVHQRFPTAAVLRRADVTYTFVADEGPPVPDRVWRDVAAMAASVVSADPDVVHVNGVVFPRWFRQLRRRLPPRVRLVAQDHGGWHPVRASQAARWIVRHGLASADAVLVSSPGHAAQWREARVVPRSVPIVDVMESSTALTPLPQDDARRRSGVRGDPAVLWVGRLTRDKDPLTVIDGFARFLAVAPQASLTVVFSEGILEAAVRSAAGREPALATRVRLIGRVPHADLAAYYSAADLFVSGSLVEGSGYAALEAMACGAAPVLTDIPSFRAMTDDGRVGVLWTPGDPHDLADALARVTAEPREVLRRQVRARFEDALSWRSIGARALAIYRDVRAR